MRGLFIVRTTFHKISLILNETIDVLKRNKKAVISQGEPRDAAINFNTYQFLQQVDNGTFMYAKHGNLVDTDASGTKASTKHPELRLEVIQSQ